MKTQQQKSRKFTQLKDKIISNISHLRNNSKWTITNNYVQRKPQSGFTNLSQGNI